MDLLERWADVDGKFRIRNDKHLAWITLANDKAVSDEVDNLARECGGLLEHYQESKNIVGQEFRSSAGRWWAELSTEFLTEHLSLEFYGRDVRFIAEPAKRSIELLKSLGYVFTAKEYTQPLPKADVRKLYNNISERTLTAWLKIPGKIPHTDNQKRTIRLELSEYKRLNGS